MLAHSARLISKPHSIEVTGGGSGRTFSVRLAGGYDDFEQAFLLLAERYRARGYEEPGFKLFRFTPFHVLRDTATVVAFDGDRLVGTLSVVPDTRLLGLPMESVYREEVDRLRREGRRLAEVTSLADDGLTPREFVATMTAMVRLALQYHESIGGDTTILGVNPRHSAFYRKAFGSIPVGERRTCPAVRDAPVEAFLSDRATMEANAPAMFRSIYGEPLPPSVLVPPARPADHVEFFGLHSTVADLRTIREIALAVEELGSPPRWVEDAAPAPWPLRRPAA